jgi:hypothetical protein
MSEQQQVVIRASDMQARVEEALIKWDREAVEIKALTPKTIETAQHRDDAAEAAKMLKELASEIEQRRTATLKPVTTFQKWVNGKLKPKVAELKKFVDEVMTQVGTWDREEKKKRDEEAAELQRQKDERAAELEAQADALAMSAVTAGLSDAERAEVQDKSDRLKAQATATKEAFTPQAAQLDGGGTGFAKTGTTKRWTVTVTNKMLFVQEVARGRIPLQALDVNKAFLRTLVPTKERPDVPEVPGLDFEERETDHVR